MTQPDTAYTPGENGGARCVFDSIVTTPYFFDMTGGQHSVGRA